MLISDIFAGYSGLTLISLALLALIAGFIDSVAGGGGLIQLPALLINLPHSPLPALFGTNKIAALAGTSVAAFQYSKRVKYDLLILTIISAFAFLASNLGARSLSVINPDTLRPLILVILIIIAIYTFLKKDLGSVKTKELSRIKLILFGSVIGFIVGFYDGFFGPGTGNFLVLGFVIILGFEFVMASAYSKIVNSVTNISALLVFISQGNYYFGLAIMMALCNIIGSIAGSRMALRRGNSFVRIVFLVIVIIMILRYSYDIFIVY
ncbi:MAG: TSUP family transporter [Saprospiraceae bacterium]|nr:TSUP family transporter [Saprospiraceae bacterium]